MAEFLDVIGTKVWRFFLLAFHSHPLQRSPPPPPRKSCLKLGCNVNIVYGNLKPENSQDYVHKPKQNCMFMNSASGWLSRWMRQKVRKRERDDLRGGGGWGTFLQTGPKTLLNLSPPAFNWSPDLEKIKIPGPDMSQVCCEVGGQSHMWCTVHKKSGRLVTNEENIEMWCTHYSKHGMGEKSHNIWN